jgi:alpha,alpha-trehalase
MHAGANASKKNNLRLFVLNIYFYNCVVVSYHMTKFGVIALLMILSACSLSEQNSDTQIDFYATELFHDVQLKGVFHDSKTFVDCIPKRDLVTIVSDYQKLRSKPDFDLKTFVAHNFELPVRPRAVFATDTSLNMEQHITKLWSVLTREASKAEPGSSLVSLPYNYVVPGGRFSEIYYWDSYFTIVGLKTQKRYDLISNMVKNFAWLVDTIGFIPNGNRNYYLTRSQPPFFSLIVKELEEYDSLAADHYLDAMTKEYDFWMNGIDSLKKSGDAHNHVVMVKDRIILNRYWDIRDTPRPEAYREDYTLSEHVSGDKRVLYRNIRAAAESGWDFSSRWFADGKSMESIHTTDIIPVDLNCLLAHLESMIAKGFTLRKNADAAYEFKRRSHERTKALMEICWDPAANFFMDYDFKTQKRTGIKSLAGVFPLFFSMPDKDVARKVSEVLKDQFLKQGGLVTTQTDTDQQWDAPNGWAPLQWLAYKGLKNYEFNKLADEIRDRWIRQNNRVFEATGKMMEKYNVMDTTLIGGGGEYPNQDGFGWTNGVALAFLTEQHVTVQNQ